MLGFITLAACVGLVQGHAQLLNIQGDAGTPASVGFQVDSSIARNCTSISPCQQDTTIIRNSEITANIVNECGRTELTGNIDIGENTENALAANAVTGVGPGSTLIITLHQVNADGAGPYVCDLEETGNTGLFSQNLTVTNNVPGVNGFSQAKTQDFNITVTMPAKFDCQGASTGNVCTVRCRNNALAGPFGGCFAVQQTAKKPATNNAASIATAQDSAAILAQIQQNVKDLPAAVAANQVDGEADTKAAAKAAAALLNNVIVSKAAAVQTLPVELNGAPAAAAPTKPAKNEGNSNGNGNGNARATPTNSSRTSNARATPANGNGAGNGAGNARATPANGNRNGNGNGAGNGAQNTNLPTASRSSTRAARATPVAAAARRAVVFSS